MVLRVLEGVFDCPGDNMMSLQASSATVVNIVVRNTLRFNDELEGVGVAFSDTRLDAMCLVDKLDAGESIIAGEDELIADFGDAWRRHSESWKLCGRVLRLFAEYNGGDERCSEIRAEHAGEDVGVVKKNGNDGALETGGEFIWPIAAAAKAGLRRSSPGEFF